MSDDSLMSEEENGDGVVQPRITCPNCKYEWSPRKVSPKQCPKCHVYLEPKHLTISYQTHAEFMRIVKTAADLDCPFLEWNLHEDTGRRVWIVSIDKKFWENMIRKRE
jgi:ssDNA-binding Zn-finger/Zn-ribbon topoisomerase 1